MKIKKIILILFFILMLPISVDAFTGDIIINCDKNVLLEGESTKCSIVGRNFSDPISSFHAKLNQDNKKIGIKISNE